MTNSCKDKLSFDFGFGNSKYYLKYKKNSNEKILFYVGANGTYSIDIINEELFSKTFGSKPKLKIIYDRTIKIIRNYGIKALSLFIDKDSDVDNLIANKEKFENIYIDLLTKENALSNLGISIKSIQINDIYFRNENTEPISIIAKPKQLLNPLIIVGAILSIIIVILLIPKTPSTSIIDTSETQTQTETTEKASKYKVGDTVYDTKNKIEYTVNEDYNLTLTRYNGSEKDLTILASYDGIKVTKIGSYAFGPQEIDHLKLSKGIEELAESAFIFSNIKHISIPSTVEIVDLYQNPFRFNSFLDFEISSENKYFKTDETHRFLLSMDGTELYAYASGQDDESPKIPTSVKIIHNQAFSGSQIKRIEIPDGVVKINFSAFLECNKLEYAFIPQSVISMSGSTFSCARGLKEIKVDENNELFFSKDGILYQRDEYNSYKYHLLHIPAKLTTREYKIPDCNLVASGAMCGNETIVVLTFPEDVEGIYSQSFIFCTNLKVVYIPYTVKFLARNVFEYDLPGELHKTIFSNEFSKAEEMAEEWGYAFASVIIENDEMHITQISLNGQTSVNIPESIDGYKIVIDEHAFDGITNVTIYGEINGYVQSFAKANGFKFKIEV